MILRCFIYYCGKFQTDTINQTVFGKRICKTSLGKMKTISSHLKPCLHTQLPEHNKSYRKVSRGWGHLITWNGPMMGHLNSFSASGGGTLNKNFPKIQMPGGLPGGGDVEASI